MEEAFDQMSEDSAAAAFFAREVIPTTEGRTFLELRRKIDQLLMGVGQAEHGVEARAKEAYWDHEMQKRFFRHILRELIEQTNVEGGKNVWEVIWQAQDRFHLHMSEFPPAFMRMIEDRGKTLFVRKEQSFEEKKESLTEALDGRKFPDFGGRNRVRELNLG